MKTINYAYRCRTGIRTPTSCVLPLHYTASISFIVQHDPYTGYASTGHHYSLSSPVRDYRTIMLRGFSLLAFVKSYVSMSKSRFVLWKRGDSNPLYISNVHQSSVVIRASPIAPLPCACLSRLSSQEPQIAKRSLVFRYNV